MSGSFKGYLENLIFIGILIFALAYLGREGALDWGTGQRNKRRNARRSRGASNTANAYADHMHTAEFQAALAELMAPATSSPIAILCAEAVPWRCHRQLISDALVAHGWEVRHIMGAGRIQLHRMTGFARVVDGRVTYPGQTLL